SVEIEKVKFESDKAVIVFGNEGSGISSALADIADMLIYVPINFESLNVAVCAGIVLYEANKAKK
ncbi:RNA methyltransferase, partial [Xanthomonas citri pv. citri]|nr:RNA methyltransferase [Xanthomonas citri pv. citri]